MEREIDGHASKVGRPISRPLRLLYAGNIGKKQGLLDFCRALADMPLDFHFRIQGNGGEAESVKNWVEAHRDRRIEFGDFLDEKNFVEALFDSDLFVITEKAGVGASFIPSKLIPCIATGTPLLCLCDGEGPLGTEVRQHKLGLCLPWAEIQDLASGLRALQDDGSKFTAMQQSAVVRSRFYTRTAVIGLIERELKNLSGC
jgi:colanic acid biosynthesis glycosyl transferase WcaI